MSLKQQTSAFMQDLVQNSVPELQENFKKIIFQMAHDLGSPLMALSIVAENSKTLSEKERSMLKESASRIREICACVLDQFNEPEYSGETSANQLFPKVDEEFADSMVSVIALHPKDTILVLDDDASVHSAWDLRFDPILKQNPELKIKHFEQANDLLFYLETLTSQSSSNTVFLSDYELVNQNINGLQVIAKANIKRAILVTSHYTNPNVLREALAMNVKILPKKLAFEVEIKISN